MSFVLLLSALYGLAALLFAELSVGYALLVVLLAAAAVAGGAAGIAEHLNDNSVRYRSRTVYVD